MALTDESTITIGDGDHQPRAAIDERAVADVVRRILASFPEVPPNAVRSMVSESLEATREARVQNFRLLLAERAVRRRLASTADRVR